MELVPKDVIVTEQPTFNVGDTLEVTKKAGGGVYYNGSSNRYLVSAMDTQRLGEDKTFFAWCASYSVDTPAVGRTYILCDESTAGTVRVDGGFLGQIFFRPL